MLGGFEFFLCFIPTKPPIKFRILLHRLDRFLPIRSIQVVNDSMVQGDPVQKFQLNLIEVYTVETVGLPEEIGSFGRDSPSELGSGLPCESSEEFSIGARSVKPCRPKMARSRSGIPCSKKYISSIRSSRSRG